MDWVSCYVLDWRLSNTLDAAFCFDALEAALALGRPDISDTDQACQFTCADFAGVRISMDSKGRLWATHPHAWQGREPRVGDLPHAY